MKTLGEIYQLSVAYLEQKHISRSKFLVQEMLCYSLNLDKLSLFMSFEKPLQSDELDLIRGRLSLLASGKPIEQIMGFVDFYGCRFKIDENVLIPRPETEILLDILQNDLSETDGLDVWDVCTGSGCIGISFKKKNPLSRVVLSDVCPKALSIAKENAVKNCVDVDFLLGDLLAPFEGMKADLILCNPPYISEEQYGGLEDCVRLNEPKKALVSGVSGLECYQALSIEVKSFLKPGGKVYFEIGFSQGQALLNIFTDPCWKQKKVIKDWAGLDRFFFLEIE